MSANVRAAFTGQPIQTRIASAIVAELQDRSRPDDQNAYITSDIDHKMGQDHMLPIMREVLTQLRRAVETATDESTRLWHKNVDAKKNIVGRDFHWKEQRTTNNAAEKALIVRILRPYPGDEDEHIENMDWPKLRRLVLEAAEGWVAIADLNRGAKSLREHG